jgi:hypothetical protein
LDEKYSEQHTDDDDESFGEGGSDEVETKLMKVTLTEGDSVNVVRVVFDVLLGRSMIGLVESDGVEPTFVCVEEVEKIEVI